MAGCDERPLDTGACNCCGDDALIERISEIDKSITELRELIKLLQDGQQGIKKYDLSKCDGNELALNAAIATCKDLEKVKKDLNDKIRRQNNFVDCNGNKLVGNEGLAQCSDIENLRSAIDRLDREITTLRDLISKLTTRVQTLEDKVNRANFGGGIDEAKLKQILDRLAALEECCKNKGDGGGTGECDFDGWASEYYVDSGGPKDDRRHELVFGVGGPPYKSFTINAPGTLGQISGVIGADGKFITTKTFFSNYPEGKFEIVHCGRVVSQGQIRNTMGGIGKGEPPPANPDPTP